MDAPTSTLADNLLDDLDDLSDVEEDEEEDDDDVQPNKGLGSTDDDNMSEDRGKLESPSDANSHSKGRLLSDSALVSHLNAIREWENSKSGSSSTKEDADKEYQLIVKSNKWLSRLGDELAATHVSLRQLYNVKFAELSDLLIDARQYQQAVETIGNEMDMTRVSNEALQQFLTPNQIITLTVAGSTTTGRPLTETELAQCHELTTYMNQIHDTQNTLTEFVTARMRNLAPSVCALTGEALAAKLIGIAGGLSELSLIPSCNLQVMGQTKQTSSSRAGFGSQGTQPHMGILVQAPLCQSVPKSERRKVLKWVAAKVALAARCDATAVQQGRPRSAVPGERFRDELQKKIQQLQTPDQAPVLKALPK